MTAKLKYTESSGNVYEDLGFKDSVDRIIKARLAMRISEIIEFRELTQTQAAKFLEINQPKVSALMNGQLSGFSIERLIKFLNNLDQDVEIVISPHKQHRTSRQSKPFLSVKCVND